MTPARPWVVVLDYGSGNLRSAERALARAGAQVSVSADPAAVTGADGLVVPGVGAFAACVAGVDRVGARQAVLDRVAASRPVLGICVGMQILFARGEEPAEVVGTTEGPAVPGLAVLPGTVRRLVAPVLPHMGWNTVRPAAGSRLFAGVEDQRFYFVHSYAALPAEVTRGAVSTSWHGQEFVAALEDGALAATQFHPEKSGAAGARLLSTWVGSL